jgi:hypothetical protein
MDASPPTKPTKIKLGANYISSNTEVSTNNSATFTKDRELP